MLRPDGPPLSLTKGLRIAIPRMFSRAAATSAPPGNSRILEVNHLSNAGRARLLEHIMRGGQVLRSDAERFVQCHIERRAAPFLGAVGDLADFGQNVLGRNGPGAQCAQELAAFIYGRIALVDE